MQKMIPTNVFFEAVMREVPRLLGQIDQNPLSPTYGSCDRAFWLYRTNDISCMRYQELALTLSLLYKTSFEGNQYFQDPRILSLAQAVIRFACRRQHRDGSFDEWYLNEGSFVCTAFVTYALSESVRILEDSLADRNAILSTLRKSGEWLMKHNETSVVNQLSGAIVALQNIFILTNDILFKDAAEEKMRIFLSLQDSEGWWSEYGGPDIGYLSLTIDYLSRYVAISNDINVHTAIEKATAFLSNFLHADGTAGGEYMARNTEYLIPSGFLRAVEYAPSTRIVVPFIAGVCGESRGVTPQSLDDRYVCYILYNWLEAGVLWNHLNNKPTPSTQLAKNTTHTFFPHSGLFTSQSNSFSFFTNLYKGGSFRLYTEHGALIDSGINFRSNGSLYASNVFQNKTTIFFDETTKTLSSKGELIKVQAPLLTTPRAIALKGIQYTIGQVPIFQKIVKKVLRKVGVFRPGATTSIGYERTITFMKGTVTIVDTVQTQLTRNDFIVGESNIYALVPSSRYAISGPTSPLLIPRTEFFEVVDGASRLTRHFSL